MIIDIHTHIWMSNYEEDKWDILHACEVYGVSKVFVSGLGSFYPVDNGEVEELNDEVGKFMREHPDAVGGSAMSALCLQAVLKQRLAKRAVHKSHVCGRDNLFRGLCMPLQAAAL